MFLKLSGMYTSLKVFCNIGFCVWVRFHNMQRTIKKYGSMPAKELLITAA